MLQNIKEMGWLKKENILVVDKIHESVRGENSKQSTRKIENIQQNKWTKMDQTGVSVCDNNESLRWMELGWHREKPSEKIAPSRNQKKIGLKWAKGKRSWCVDN